jgi:hypothetical protein
MRGGAQAHLIEGHDGNCYVVKFTNNLQHRRVLVNEWLAAHLMRHIGIPTPPTALVNVSPEFLAENGEVYLQGNKTRIAVDIGVHFGSRYPGHPDTTAIHDVLPDSLLARLSNRNDFIGAMVFDCWVSNTDAPQAIFVPHTEAPQSGLETELPGKTRFEAETRFEALMIDRGFAFGGTDWRLRYSPIARLHPRKVFYDGLRGIDDCQPWLSRIEATQHDFLRHLIDTIPQSWRHAADSGLERLLRDLLVRRSDASDSIIASANSAERPFRNWTNSSARKTSGSTRTVL